MIPAKRKLQMSSLPQKILNFSTYDKKNKISPPSAEMFSFATEKCKISSLAEIFFIFLFNFHHPQPSILELFLQGWQDGQDGQGGQSKQGRQGGQGGKSGQENFNVRPLQLKKFVIFTQNKKNL